ncbi:Long-chain-fatty-acid--CoA ligase [Nocardioides dokdonensis FR1436]|uniref:Long-chain-fatty-acid--CoA ligase n=1 Tax=Nocardioides dokdonensis FR1436 TaxID=1300347 RepID=A0A1A9GFM2_9ACTN|nr:AMP-binding protein [Nocardioides dokdonensis]ANH37087.1 Long-chain-fatty-acid--CoA ligase [Nocardioides dokdonensis FR1436]
MADLVDARTLGELCELRARTHPTRPAVRDDELELDFASLAARARVVARFLGEQGVQVGDRVVVHGANRVTWVVAAYGVLLAGATVVPIGHRVPDAERQGLLDLLAPRLVLQDDSGTAVPGGIAFSRLEALAPVPEPSDLPAVDPTSPALVLTSSGTSGAVKAVPMSHAQLLRMYDDVRTALDVEQDDVWLGVVPLAHSFGINGILLVAFLAGACVRLLPDYRPERLVRVLRSERVSVLAGPPTIYHDLAEIDPGVAGAHTRLAIVGSTEVSAPDTARLARRLAIPRVVVGYGMTETCGTVAVGELPADPDDLLPWMSPMPGVEVRVCDDSGAPLPPGVPGAVQVRGYPVSRPYAGAPDLRAGLQPGHPDEWFDTRDVGRLDAHGRLAIVGRTDDTVIVSGFNVFPREVEAVLREHPGVADVAVVGGPDARRGQRLVACVVVADEPPTPEALTAHVRARLTGYKVPSEFVFLDELPRTRTEKVSRAALRGRVDAGTGPISGATDR